MKTFALAAALAVLSTQASAATFSPASKTFKADGTLLITVNGKTSACPVELSGKTGTGSTLKINGLAQGLGCLDLHGTVLPWYWRAKASGISAVFDFQLNGFDCPEIAAIVSDSGGVLTIPQSGGVACQVRGTLTTTPAIVVLP